MWLVIFFFDFDFFALGLGNLSFLVCIYPSTFITRGCLVCAETFKALKFWSKNGFLTGKVFPLQSMKKLIKGN